MYITRIVRRLKSVAIRQGAIVVIDQGLLSVATFVTGVLVARSSNKEEFAIYVLSFSILMILQGMQKALVNLPLSIYLPRLDALDKNKYLGSTLVHSIVYCSVAAGGLLIFQESNLHSNNEIISKFTALTTPLIMAFSALLLREYIRSSLLAELKLFQSVTANITATVLMLALVIWCFINKTLTIAMVFYIIAGSSSLAIIIMILQDPKRYSISLQRILSDFITSFKIGKWFVMNAFATMGTSQAYPWLALYILNSNAVAVYGACIAIAGIMNPFLRGANAYILPRMTHSFDGKSTKELFRLLRASVLFLCIPYGVWLILGSLLGEQILVLFYSDLYAGNGILVILLLIKIFIESISSPLTSALQTLQRPHLTTISLILGAAITLLAGPLLIASYGLVGLGTSAVAASVAMAAWKLYALRTYSLKFSPT